MSGSFLIPQTNRRRNAVIEPAIHTVIHGARYARELLVGRRPLPRPAHPRHTKHVVLLSPGFLGPASVVHKFQVLFERKGFATCEFHVGFHSVRTFDAIVERFAARIREIRNVYPDLERLDLVVHSMAGLFALDAIKRGELDGLRVRLVTLGTPHRGTWSALPGCLVSFSAYHLIPLHPRYRTDGVAGRLEQIPFLSVSGSYDLLSPPERCFHPMAHLKCLPMDHVGLIMSKEAFRVIHDFLSAEKTHPALTG
jgi:hypothetical protein